LEQDALYLEKLLACCEQSDLLNNSVHAGRYFYPQVDWIGGTEYLRVHQ
jgi:hypothetical protein